ncbi:MAG TPA: poly(R)-hydroxyalkanoic acid synthase subunit PhaE [Steroidobacteraceae bacterium]|jgi:class III poly(R)-hydroxyalkanoic acid synthase PhaE subunit
MNARAGIPGGGFPFSADFLKVWIEQVAAATSPAAPWTALNDMFPSTSPALGLSREYQEIGAKLLELGQQFQRRCAELTQQSAAVMQDALQILKQRTEADQALLKSPPDLYDEWIDCAESCYAQAARGDAFASLFAEICNIASAIKVERGKLVEQMARQLDLPSRAEVDTLNRQLRVLSAALTSAKPPSKKPVTRARKPRKRSRP